MTVLCLSFDSWCSYLEQNWLSHPAGTGWVKRKAKSHSWDNESSQEEGHLELSFSMVGGPWPFWAWIKCTGQLTSCIISKIQHFCSEPVTKTLTWKRIHWAKASQSEGTQRPRRTEANWLFKSIAIVTHWRWVAILRADILIHFPKCDHGRFSRRALEEQSCGGSAGAQEGLPCSRH